MNTPNLVLCEIGDPNLPRLESFSPFCLKVHRALKLAGFEYERRHGHPGAFRALNPAIQVPVLLVDDRPVADSTRILSKLEELSGGALSGDLDAAGRAEAFLWEEMADTVLSGFLVTARWIDEENWRRTKPAYFAGMPGLVRAIVPERIRRRIRTSLYAREFLRPDIGTCWVRFEETLDRLEERAPSGGFWLGGSISRADVAIFAQLWSLRTPLTERQGASVAARPRLTAWLDRVDAACLEAERRNARESGAFGRAGDPALRMAASFG